jgi:general secretion pathway protein D
VSTQFNFADTGITMVITPQVHSATEMTLHVEITVSAVKEYLTIGGTGGLSQPVITQNKSITDLRLRDGEVSLLSGLSQTQDSSSINGTPGLINVPVLGQLLGGTHHTEKDRTQLLIAMIPHIVRTPDYTPENLKGIFAGWEQTVKINYAPTETPAAGQTPAPGAAPGPGAPGAGQPAPAQPGVPPPPPAPGPGQARLSLSPAPARVAPNSDFTVTVQLDNAADLFSVSPLRVKFDPARVRLGDVTAGPLLGQALVEKDIRNDTGDATVTLTRPPGSAGVNGSGAAAILRFTAVSAGAANISIIEGALKDTKLQAVPAAVGTTQVTIQ